MPVVRTRPARSFGSLTEKVETGSPTQKQLFDKMWQLPDIEKINLSEGRAVKELAPVTPAPAQNITQQEAYEIAKDSYVSAARN
jgi:hypothetical protein